MSPDSASKQRLVEHLRTHAVRTDGPFTLRSGAVSDWYIDARQTTFDGAGAAIVGEAVLDALDPRVVAVGGLTMGADPIAVATAIAGAAARRPLRAFSVRKEAKGHGTGGRLVGPVGSDDVVAVLEDTTTTGSAMFEAIEALSHAGIRIAQVITLVDRSGGVAEAKVMAAGIPYLALVVPRDLGVEE
ncbi:MAG: orotate phosphoribosyltransferase [Actinomycetota bacterium]|nr:orotate phosphoribosyltransferase [Actinomycetota bacterium]